LARTVESISSAINGERLESTTFWPSYSIIRRSRFVYRVRIALVVLCVVADAAAYCRTRTCAAENSAEPCIRDASQCALNGAALYWPKASVDVWVDPRGSSTRAIDGESARRILEGALRSWTTVDCGGSRASIAVGRVELLTAEAVAALGLTVAPDDAGAVPIGTGESAADTRANTLSFVDGEWHYIGKHAIAITTVSFGAESGRIVGADIEVNSGAFNVTADDTAPDFDLASILTHEAGHLWGLDDVWSPGPTMFGLYDGNGNLGPRSLDTDDVTAICDVYPSGRFDDEPSGCQCVVPVNAPRGVSSAWVALAGIGIAIARRQRRPIVARQRVADRPWC
jgi:hypothetical protein